MSYRNSSGYSDPTAGAVIPAVAREQRMSARGYKPLVFIISGDTCGNIDDAKRYCRFVIERRCIPLVADQHYTQVLEALDDENHTLGLYFSLILLTRFDELWVFGDEKTDYSEQLILKAERRRMTVRYFTKQCKEAGVNAK